MAQRKLQQEVDRCFKRVAEGITAFEGTYDKLQQTSNPSQKEKLEDVLKREIKKLQRHRDQIKSWAASNEIKDKKPLLEQRKLIETQMEKFKAVEKEMKTKAYSKEGLSAAAKLDPKEKEKVEICGFLSNMVEELERQIETFETEMESITMTLKKGRKDSAKAERLSSVENSVERHKWHQSKLELILRLVENGGLEAEKVSDIKDDIKYYVECNGDQDFTEDESMFDGLNLDEEEDLYNVGLDNDRLSSQDNQSIYDEPPEKKTETHSASSSTTRRPSSQLKSPLPTLATIHSAGMNGTTMKPAPPPTRPAGEPLKYASAAAAAAAADKIVGIAPLPPPPSHMNNAASSTPPVTSAVPVSLASTKAKPSPKPSKATVVEPIPEHTTSPPESVPASVPPTPQLEKVNAAAQSSAAQTPSSTHAAPVSVSSMQRETSSQSSTHHSTAQQEETTPSDKDSKAPAPEPVEDDNPNSLFSTSYETRPSKPSQKMPSRTSSPRMTNGATVDPKFKLPPGLQDLIASFEAVKARKHDPTSPHSLRLLAASAATLPVAQDAERPKRYKPQTPYKTPAHYPQEPLGLLEEPSFFGKVDTDTLFYIFYYRQGTYQQYLAAQRLKQLSWRFHKQYQTWFQRHEEPKVINEEFEQGTYRFFDYESTWMNRRKTEFKFAYKFLEDDLST
ncbi:proteinral negative regulator of transcription subunit 5 [Orbilia oligospora]|uniref:General negative regulator of transcription subunit n=1 Tax=Orbilia oligospora TaxID=2813651 RepID=A0A6G1LTQ0_ORBOL|nr:proteinral negative regulator of transcription subunit 5 [Orbilia oligospora]KAF3204040.1 proteinral negative regulator of transcription subunit 5 [Orbilia oligospora]KAF3204516.1 proteinral negative regulator of transcription subunit 5 [Orbilia oligospora]KAF3233224.1 proteinral negative regulator of transcription subunit 5 [Orbilia oligospora]